MNEFDNHNFQIYFGGHFRCLVDQHVEIRNQLCFGNGLKLYSDKSEPQSMLPNTHKAILLYLDIIKYMLSHLFDAPGSMSTTLINCFCSDKTSVQESWLIKNAMRHYNKAIAPRQRSLCKADVLSAGRMTSASCCNETSGGCVISTYIFQNQNWHDILPAV